MFSVNANAFLLLLKCNEKSNFFILFLYYSRIQIVQDIEQWGEDQKNNNHLENKLIVNKQGIILIMENQSVHQKFANICILKPFKNV